LGLGIGKTDLELTRELFKQQMRQSKRLWTADWAEASLRHGEACLQAAQQHAEAQALASASYYQAERTARQSMKLARDQDMRAYEMAFRSEVRESLRDELQNQNNRFNIIMLCDTVCLSCVFTLVADGNPPLETDAMILRIYVLLVGLSVTIFAISLWCSVIVVRRLHEHTAGSLERKLFAQSEDLQTVWKEHLNKPTGAHELHLFNQAYENWVDLHINPLGVLSIHLLSIGVVVMFAAAGLLVHAQYMVEYKVPVAAYLFWGTVAITSSTIIVMKLREDRTEKTKQGVYDVSWQDNTETFGPFAKISQAAAELSNKQAEDLTDVKRMHSLRERERQEKKFLAKTESLHDRVASLRKESSKRTKTRKDILKLLTTAAEELDALPEDLTSKLNKLLHDIDEADGTTANLIITQPENQLTVEASSRSLNRFTRMPSEVRPMAQFPIDAQRIPVSLVSLRKKLGEIALTTLLRIRNQSDEPLRLQKGVQLKSGKYIQSLSMTNPLSESVCHHLYPVTEIPPRTEVVIAARSTGRSWMPTSGVDGEIVYTNKDESWRFKIHFLNEFVRGNRKCHVKALQVGYEEDATERDEMETHQPESDSFWTVTRNEIDRKANNEIVVSINSLKGDLARKAEEEKLKSRSSLKSGYLLKNKLFGFGLQWQQRWFEVTNLALVYSQSPASQHKTSIDIHEVSKVAHFSDMVHKYAFEIFVEHDERSPYRLAAKTLEDREEWTKQICVAAGIPLTVSEATDSIQDMSLSTTSSIKDGFECVENGEDTNIIPV